MKYTRNWEIGREINAVDPADRAGGESETRDDGPSFLVVDDNDPLLEMLSSLLSARHYRFHTARSLHEAKKALESSSFDILIFDIRLSDGDIFLLLDEQPTLCDQSVVLLMSGADELDYAVRAMRRGVVDFIVKPFSISSFDERLAEAIEKWSERNQIQYHQEHLEGLVTEMNTRLTVNDRLVDEAYDGTVRALGAAIGLRDPETEEHSQRVARNSVVLAEWIGYPPELMKQLEWGSCLHDIGKIGVPESILAKKGPLTEMEIHVVRQHPVVGNRLISNIAFLRGASDVVLHHHERYDGTGYPDGLRGKDIPFAARIFSVIDTMDAILFDRPYRKASTYDAFIAELKKESGKQFDPDVVAAVLEMQQSAWWYGGDQRAAV